MDYYKFVKKIKDKTPFAFTRWGDGEFNCIFQDSGRQFNTDCHNYFADLGAELRRVLFSQHRI